MKVYTGSGDHGVTDLQGGIRINKDSLRISLSGSVDELNSVLGIIHSVISYQDIKDVIRKMQNELHICLADLSNLDMSKKEHRITPDIVKGVEELIAGLEVELPPLKKFVIPGGSPAGAYMHFARTVCRRCERDIVTLAKTETINPEVTKYLNRLSDLLFVLARIINKRDGVTEASPEY